MQFTTTFLLTVLTAATAVVATPNEARALFKRDNCDTRYTYCGHTLMKKGRYARQILAELDRLHKPHDQFEDAFFGCIGGPDGDIKYIQYCGKGRCHDAGSGHSDYCV